MSHLAVIQAAGRELADEYERRVATLPSAAGVIESREELASATAARDRARARLDDNIVYLRSVHAANHGFASWDALLAARDAGAGDRSDAAMDLWSRAFDAMMSQDFIDQHPNVKDQRALLARWNQEVSDAQAEYDKAFIQGAAGRRDVAFDILADLRPMGGKKLAYVSGDASTAPGVRLAEGIEPVQGMRYAEGFYPTDWLELIDQAKDGKPWKLGSVPRGNHKWHAQEINLSTDKDEQVPGAGRSGRVALHELGHGMEQAVPGLLAMQRAFLWSRTSTGEIGDREREEIKHLGGGYAEHEKAYFDDFPTAYTGKPYGEVGSGEAYEVFTTGVESMFGGSNYLDDDFRAWMFGVMALLGEPKNRAAEVAEERRTQRRAQAAEVAKDDAGVPWRLDYEYLSAQSEEQLDELADHLAQGLASNEPRELERWQDYEAYLAAQEGVDAIVTDARGMSDDEVTAAVDAFLAENGRPGLTHPRVGGTGRNTRTGPTRAEVQDEYATFLEVQYLDAEEATRGSMLNPAGQRDGIDPRALFTGDVRLVYRYASEELLSYWETTRRVGWSEYLYERTGAPGAAKAARRQAEQNARINRDRTEAGARVRSANRTRRTP